MKCGLTVRDKERKVRKMELNSGDDESGLGLRNVPKETFLEEQTRIHATSCSSYSATVRCTFGGCISTSSWLPVLSRSSCPSGTFLPARNPRSHPQELSPPSQLPTSLPHPSIHHPHRMFLLSSEAHRFLMPRSCIL